MPQTRALVLDANILISAVLGTKVGTLLATYAESVAFMAPDIVYADARRHLPGIVERRGIAPEHALNALGLLEPVVTPITETAYAPARDEALMRIGGRDADDWPILALALVMDCPIWTQDQDFFGTGVATWTTNRVELYLRNKTSSVQ